MAVPMTWILWYSLSLSNVFRSATHYLEQTDFSDYTHTHTIIIIIIVIIIILPY
jgi:hypothetical protein